MDNIYFVSQEKFLSGTQASPRTPNLLEVEVGAEIHDWNNFLSLGAVGCLRRAQLELWNESIKSKEVPAEISLSISFSAALEFLVRILNRETTPGSCTFRHPSRNSHTSTSWIFILLLIFYFLLSRSLALLRRIWQTHSVEQLLRNISVISHVMWDHRKWTQPKAAEKCGQIRKAISTPLRLLVLT